MPLRRSLLIGTLVTAPPAYYIYSTINRLERTYPQLPPESTTTVSLQTPSDPKSQHTPHVDVYGARVPLKALLREAEAAGFHSSVRHDPVRYESSIKRSLSRLFDTDPSLEEAWARAFFASPILRLEGRIIGGWARDAGDVGGTGFRGGQVLLNGALRALRAPSSNAPLMVEWGFPRALKEGCRKAAGWGYPWRFMSGGRHEWSVGRVERDGNGKEWVEVRFASAHDYVVVEEERARQKVIPKWTGRLHRAYARWLLDERVRAVRGADEERKDAEKS